MNFLRSVIADARPRQTLYGQPDGFNTMDGAMAGREFHGPDSHALPEEIAFPTAPDQSNLMNRAASIHDNHGLQHEGGVTDVSLPRSKTYQDYSVEMEAGDLLSADTPELVKEEKEHVQPDGVPFAAATFNPDVEKNYDFDRGVGSHSAATIDSDADGHFTGRIAHNFSSAALETPDAKSPPTAYEENGTVEARVGTIERSIGKKAAESGVNFAGMEEKAGVPANRQVEPGEDVGESGEVADHSRPQKSGDDPKALPVQAKAAHGMVESSPQDSSQAEENREVASTIPAVSTSENPPSDTDADNHFNDRQAHNLSTATFETPNAENPPSAYEENGTVEARVGTIERSIGKKAAENGKSFAGMEGGAEACSERQVMPGADDRGSGKGSDHPRLHRSGDGLKKFPAQSKAVHERDESSPQGSGRAGVSNPLASAIPAVFAPENPLSDTPEIATGDVDRHQRRQGTTGSRKSNNRREGMDVLIGIRSPAMLELKRQDDESTEIKSQSNRGAHENDIVRLQKANGSTNNGQNVPPASLRKKTAVSHPPVSDLKPFSSKADAGKIEPDSVSPHNTGFVRSEASGQHNPGTKQGGDRTKAIRSVPATPVITGSKPLVAAPRNPQARQQYAKTPPAEPKVQIGHIDVIIEAQVQADKAPASTEATRDLASRYYLRGL